MSYPFPTRVTTKGPFQPMRFEATVEECIVTHGEIPRIWPAASIAPGRVGSGRPTGHDTAAGDGRHDARACLRQWPRRLPQPLGTYPKSCWKTNAAAACSIIRWRIRRYADYGYGEVARYPENAHTPRAPAVSTSSRSPASSPGVGRIGGPHNHRSDHAKRPEHRGRGRRP